MALREKNITLHNTITTSHLSNQTTHRSLAHLESPDNFSLPCHAQTCSGYLHNNKSSSSGRDLDPALHALDDMSSYSFILAILSHDAPPHCTLPKFQKYNNLQDPFDHLMHYRQFMTLQAGNDELLCKFFPSIFAGPVFREFVAQYMGLVRRRQSMTSLFHVRIRESETICDFMKRFGVALLQLEAISTYTALQAVKQVIRQRSQFFYSLSL